MRVSVEHATAARTTADPIVIQVTLQDGSVGYGETLARRYVTGEDRKTVYDTIKNDLLPIVIHSCPQTMQEGLDQLNAMPVQKEGRMITASRAALELALLEAYSKHFCSEIPQALAEWLPDRTPSSSYAIDEAQCTGVIATASMNKARTLLRMMACYGLRQFKIKAGTPQHDQVATDILRAFARRFRSGQWNARIDANAGWSLDEARRQMTAWRDLGVRYVEQPLPRGQEGALQDLRGIGIAFIHDESLVTMEDAIRLEELGVADCLNIRISKCGGLMPSLALIQHCQSRGIEYMLGSMVGQTSILAAVERRLLEVCSGCRFVESNYGRFLLRDDVASRSLRFGYGGVLTRLSGVGWGVEVDQRRLESLSEDNVTWSAESAPG